MQVTVTIPDELAAQAQGLSPERYIEPWAANQTVPGGQTYRARKLVQLETFSTEIAADSQDVPLLLGTAFTRETFYRTMTDG